MTSGLGGLDFRELGKSAASRIPGQMAESVANYAVLRARPDLLPRDYVIRDHAAYFAKVCDLVGGPDAPLTFLEFGVYRGNSLRQWAGLNHNPGSVFLGFDSFTGLPARWRNREAGYFDTNGKPPDIADPRVRCVAGWFNQTLPGALATLPKAEPDRQVLVHIDADLHASALYCLTTLGLALGQFPVMFDEYGAGEARALRDVLDAYGGTFEPLLGMKRRTWSALPTRVFGLFTFGSSPSNMQKQPGGDGPGSRSS